LDARINGGHVQIFRIVGGHLPAAFEVNLSGPIAHSPHRPGLDFSPD
jgi:hypothetical protein